MIWRIFSCLARWLFLWGAVFHIGVGLASAQAEVPTAAKSYLLPPACETLGKSNPGISELLTATAIRPTAEAYNALGALFAQENKFDCAIPAFEQALRLDHQNQRARYNLALGLIRTGQEKAASDQLRLLIKEDPKSGAAHETDR